MKIIIGFCLALLLLQSCNSSPKKEKEPVKVGVEVVEEPSFFPVTDYINGQIREIQVNPIRYVTIKGHTDSSWLQVEQFNEAFSDFTHPRIDSLNLVPWFKETRFMDKTVDAFTFTYEPFGAVPDSLQLQRWDVYVDPKTEKVRRIFLVKSAGQNKTRQLTWQGGKWCKIVDIIHKTDGTSEVEKEIKISWDF